MRGFAMGQRPQPNPFDRLRNRGAVMRIKLQIRPKPQADIFLNREVWKQVVS